MSPSPRQRIVLQEKEEYQNLVIYLWSPQKLDATTGGDENKNFAKGREKNFISSQEIHQK